MALRSTGPALLAYLAFALVPSAHNAPPNTKKVQEGTGYAPRRDWYGDPLPAGAVARLGSMRLRHLGQVRCVVYSPDGKLLLSASEYGEVRLWEAATGKLVRHYQCASHVNCLAFSRDGALIGAGTENGALLVEVATGKVHDSLPGNGEVLSLAFSPDGKRLVYAGTNSIVRLWSLTNEKPVRSWDSQQHGVRSLAFSPDNKTLASAGLDLTIRLWDASTNKQIRTIQAYRPKPKDELTTCRVHCMLYSPDGKVLVAGTSGAEYGRTAVQFWDAATGRELQRLRGPLQERTITAVALSPDGKLLAVAGFPTSLKIYKVGSGQLLHDLQNKSINCLSFSPDGQTLASGDMGGAVRFWKAATGKERARPAGHQWPVVSVLFSPDGKGVVTRDDQGELRLWDAATGKPLRVLAFPQRFALRENCACLVFLSDGHTLVGTLSQESLGFWDMRTGKQVRHYRPGRQVFDAFSLTPDGKRLALRLGDSERLVLWDLAARRQLVTWEIAEIGRLAFAPGGKLLAAANASDLFLWEAASGKLVRRFKHNSCDITALAFSPDGKLLALGDTQRMVSGSNIVIPDRTFSVWDVGSGKELLRVNGRQFGFKDIAFSPDGRTLATANEQGPIRLWETATGKELLRFRGFGAKVNALCFSPGGRLLALALSNCTTLLWDLKPDGWKKPAGPLGNKELASLWTDLAKDDASTAYQAVWTLSVAPAEVTPFLAQHLRPVPRVSAEQIAQLVADLDHNSFWRRQTASKELARLDVQAGPTLRKALARAKLAEVRGRLESLLKPLGGWAVTNPETLRTLRAIWVLERIRTPAARAILEKLAQGAPEARTTQESKAALAFLANRFWRRKP